MCYNVFIIPSSEYIGGLLASLLPCRLIFPCTHCLGLHIRSSGPRCMVIIQAQVEQTSCTKFMLWTGFEPAVNGQSMGIPAFLQSMGIHAIQHVMDLHVYDISDRKS